MLPGVGYQEVVVLLIIAVLLFGSRLPEVLQNLGKSYAKLRKGLNDIQSTFQQPIEDQNDYFDSGDEDEDQAYESPFSPEVSTPKFTLPESEEQDVKESELATGPKEQESDSNGSESEKSE